MGDIKIASHMVRKRSVRSSSGGIIDLLDESDGGWIIKGGHVVNQEKFQEMQKKAEDRKIAAKALAEAVSAPAEVVSQRNGLPGEAAAQDVSRIDALEKRMDGQDAKLDAILEAITKNKDD